MIKVISKIQVLNQSQINLNITKLKQLNLKKDNRKNTVNNKMETIAWTNCWKRTPLTTAALETKFFSSSSFLECNL